MDIIMRQDLAAAAGEGIITPEQADRLGAFLAARRSATGEPGSGADPASNPLEDSEMPRFVRGFHDILITIGILILLAGISGLSHPALALVAIIPLAELLVRRQRLALPAFTLTLAYGGSVTALLMLLMPSFFETQGEEGPSVFFFFLAGYVLTFVPFYWRYRVPVALAVMIVLAGGTFVLMLAAIAELALYDKVGSHPLLTMAFGLAGALAILAVALRFDLSDPGRVTRRSDVAFWLHLVAAPALLYSLLAVLFFLRAPENDSDISAVATSQPVTVVLLVVAFILFGLVFDRRAFVTSSLLSLGLSLGTLFRQGLSGLDSVFFVVLLALGLIVLVIGVSWPHLRRLVIGALPPDLKTRLPPLR
ncbi:hypothetical protein [Gellertiella hungarica]|uniref:DUF2157 domain-containing protein n=2 Tax=Gellertiella hungarica TaxID=1572859 RepID=A0A7W6NJL1_9HYPH|nr:hypothetical protein [Gellertiella hungarica]MBB4063397.1 hypothetical protein [Gellertiella hungarica]